MAYIHIYGREADIRALAMLQGVEPDDPKANAYIAMAIRRLEKIIAKTTSEEINKAMEPTKNV